MVQVQDNGPGSRDMAGHLFDPFVSSKPSGTGLGLSLVAKIVGDHGGVVEFENLERGAAFRVRLPAYRGGDGAPTESAMAEPTVIVADDDAGIRTVISRALSREGYGVQATGTAATLWRWIEDGTGDVAILDVVLPDENALDLLPRIKQRRPGLPVIMMSAQNTLLTAVRATERGAFDYLPKPFDLAQLVTMVKRALALPQKTEIAPEELNRLEEQLPIIGRSAPMQEIYRVVARLVGTDLTVMINGESGTGKELVAKAIHDYGKRRGGPFIAVNMAAIPRELVESELFGHEKGAFTGANARKVGGSSRPRAAPCSSTRSATCRSRPRPGCCACCSPASSCRSAAACRSRPICGSSRRPSRPAPAGRAGTVSRRPVLSPERRAHPAAAAARARRRHPGAGPAFPQQRAWTACRRRRWSRPRWRA